MLTRSSKIWQTTKRSITLQNNDVYFAVKLNGQNPEKLFDPTYFSFKIAQMNYLRTSTGFSTKETIIEYEFWGDKFPHVEKPVYDKIGLSTYVCPKNTDFFIRANLNSDNYEVIQITIGKWSGSNCKSESEINRVLNTNYIDIALISSYFDFEDYENPIHYYLQDMNLFNLIPSLSLQVQYQAKQNQAVMNDDIFLGSQGLTNEVNFYSIERKRISYSSIDFNNAYLQAYITFDPQVDQYQRTVYSFLDMLGFIGGISELLKRFGYFMVCYFIKRAYYSSIISKLYHIETQRNSKATTIQNKKDSVFANNKNKSIESHQRNKVAPIYLQSRSSLISIMNNNKEESKYGTNNAYVENIYT